MAATSAEALRIAAHTTAITDLENRLKIVEREIGARATVGALQALSNRIDIDISELADITRRVESKVGHITDPKETLALIGVEDLRTIKTHLRQLLVIKQELDDMRKSLIDMLTSYDMGQATTIGS